MKTVAFTAETPQELDERIQQAMAEGLHPSLACIFCSITQPLDEVRTVFAQRGISLFGCTSSGEIANDSTAEDAMAVMLFDLPKEAYQLKMFDGGTQTSYQMGESIATWAKGTFESPILLVLSGGLQTDGEAVVHGILDTAGYPIPLYGGLAGDNLQMQATFAFSEAEISGYGVLVLALDGSKVEVHGRAVSGWRGIGSTRTVTHSVGNVVYSIDNQPALDVYSRYLNINIGDDHSLAAEYPLLLLRDDGTFVLRAAMIVNPDKSMVYAGAVPQGSKVQLSIPPSTEIIDFAMEKLSEFKEEENIEADAAILFSCKGRHLALGPMMDDEISALHNLWQIPLVGLFTYGEIGPALDGRCDFHNDTLSFVTLRSK